MKSVNESSSFYRALKGMRKLLRYNNQQEFTSLEEANKTLQDYQIWGEKILGHMLKAADEIDKYLETTEADKILYASVYAEVGQLKAARLEEARNQKDVWTIADAAREMSVSPKTLQNKISKLKSSGNPPIWLVEKAGEPTRVRAKEFMEWLKGHKKRGRPVQELR